MAVNMVTKSEIPVYPDLRSGRLYDKTQNFLR